MILKVIIEKYTKNNKITKTQAAFNVKSEENYKILSLNGVQSNTTTVLPNTSKSSNLFQSVFRITHKQSSIPR